MDNLRPNTISAICPQCGAQMEVDASQDAVICRYCGKPFSVQKGVVCYNERYTLPGPSTQPTKVDAWEEQQYYYEPPKPRRRHTFWWIMGWLFCFPIPLTILLKRNRRIPGGLRSFIILLAWVAYIVLALHAWADRAGLLLPTVTRHTSVIVETSTPRPTSTARPASTPRFTASPTPQSTATPEPEVTPVPTEEPTAAGGVTPEFKEAMDSYEAFFDEYIAFMRSYSENPEDLGLLLQYMDFLVRYEDAMDALDAIDESELSPADDAYYLEVMLRIDAKLLETANYMS